MVNLVFFHKYVVCLFVFSLLLDDIYSNLHDTFYDDVPSTNPT